MGGGREGGLNRFSSHFYILILSYIYYHRQIGKTKSVSLVLNKNKKVLIKSKITRLDQLKYYLEGPDQLKYYLKGPGRNNFKLVSI